LSDFNLNNSLKVPGPSTFHLPPPLFNLQFLNSTPKSSKMASAATQSRPSHTIPSYQRVEPGSVNIKVEDLTKIKTVEPKDIDNATEEWVSSFNKALQCSDYDALTDIFLPNAFWRDHLCLSWDFHTMKGTDKIKEFLKTGCRLKKITIDRSSDFRKPVVTGFDGQGRVQGVQTFLTTESDVGRGIGVARLVQQEGKLKAFTFFTSMRELKGHEEAIFGRRPEGVAHGGQPGRKNWQERRVAEENFEGSEPTVLILGKSLIPKISAYGIETNAYFIPHRRGPRWTHTSCSSENAWSQRPHHRP
jgi:hypothetical protein